MFGCGKVLRNWSSESRGGRGVPTHVTVYDLDKVERERGLTPEGMIMVALMSGGDYIPAGIPGCGIRIAVDAARAGFGRELCALGGRGDEEGLKAWRERFTHELRTNERKLFTRKNSKIVIPESFPDRQVLGYYLRPVVSAVESEIVRRRPRWGGEVDWVGLRSFVREVFEWRGKGGAKKLMRTLAAGVLIGRLFNCGQGKDKGVKELVEKISGRRVHHSTDGLVELRVAYTPATVVPIDLGAEPDDENDSSEVEDGEESGDVDSEDGGTKGAKRKPKGYDPFSIERVWIPERVLQLSVSETVQEWEKGLNKPKKKAAPKEKAATEAKKRRAKAVEKDAGAIEKFLKVAKPTAAAPVAKPPKEDTEAADEVWWIPPPLPRRDTAPASPHTADVPQFKPPPAKAPRAARAVPNPSKKQSTANLKGAAAVTKPASKAPKPPAKSAQGPSSVRAENPWSLALKNPPGPNHINTASNFGATASTAAKNKLQVKSRIVSESSLSSPLPTPAKKPSASKGRSRSRLPPKASSPPTTGTWKDIDSSSSVGLSKSKKKAGTSTSNGSTTYPEPSRSRSFEIPSSPLPPAEDFFLGEPPSPEWPSPIHLHSSKRQGKPSPQIEVIDLLSSSPPACFSADTSPTTTKWAASPSSVPGTPPRRLTEGFEESPNKKQKTPESIRRASLAEENDAYLLDTPASVSRTSSKRLSGGFIEPLYDESSYDYDAGLPAFGYDDYFGFYEQDLPSPKDAPESRSEAISKVNRRLDFSAPLPPPQPEEDSRDIFLSSEPLPNLPPLNTNLPQSSSAYAHSRNDSTASTSSSSAYSDFSVPLSTPISAAERQPIRDFSWITTTRGNFSPRKQLKRVMEGVFPSPLSPSKEDFGDPNLLRALRSEKSNSERELAAKTLSPIEALHEIMNTPTPGPLASSLKELQQPQWDCPQSRTSSRASEGSVISTWSLGPGFDELGSSTQAAPEQITPPRRRMKSMIPIPSAKKNKPQAPPPPAPAPATAPKQRHEATIKAKPSQQKLQVQMKQVRKAASAPPPTATKAENLPPKQKPMKVQSMEGGGWRELDELGFELGAMQTIGRKGGLGVKRSLGKIKVWEDVDVVDLTGE